MIGCLNIVARKIKTKHKAKQSKTASSLTSQSELPADTEAMDLNEEHLKRGARPKQTQKGKVFGDKFTFFYVSKILYIPKF